jgi:Fic/DOC family
VAQYCKCATKLLFYGAFDELRHMPKQIQAGELDPVLSLVAGFPAGVAFEEIAKSLEPRLPRRTLQRRLALLVQQKHLLLEGRGRGSRYRVPAIVDKPLPDGPQQPPSKTRDLPVSSEGQEIRKAVRAPINERLPVGYNRSFLDSYRPNETSYLSITARKRLEQVASVPGGAQPAGTYARKILDRLLIDLSWNSSRLEGNTYSLLETERLLELGEAAEGKDALEAQMILNHKAAIELLVEHAEETGFNRYTVLNLHGLLADNLLSDPQAGGRLRSIPVAISGTVFHPLEGPQLIEECFDQILATAAAIKDPLEQAFFVMVHIPYLQPFEDVNKRVSRLAANIPFIRHNLCPLSFVDVPERDYVDGILGVYELNRIDLLRDVFIWAYERSSARYAAARQSLGEPDPFRLRYRDTLVATVAAIIRGGMDRRTAIDFIRREVDEKAPPGDRKRLVELIETEVMSLHEGNFARYRVQPSEYHAWRAKWDDRVG